MTRYGMMTQLEWVCSHCSAPLMVQALSNEHICTECMAIVEIPTSKWRGWFSMPIVWTGLTKPFGQAVQIQELFEKVTVSCGRRDPRCQACKKELPIDQLEVFAAEGGYSCPCGERVQVREAGPLAQALVPVARWVVNEGVAKGSDGAGSVSFQCSGCAAPLAVDGSERTVVCTYCSSSTFLPDGIWLRLHPKASKRVIFVVLESDEGLAKLIDENNNAQKILSRPTMPAEILGMWQPDADEEVAEAVAANPSTPAVALGRMAGVDSSEMHKALAANPNCSTETLDVLAEKGWSDKQIAGNANARPELLVKLSEKNDRGIKRKLAGNPASPEQVIRSLVTTAATDDKVAHRLARRKLPLEVVLQLSENESVAETIRMRPDYQAWNAEKQAARSRRLLMVAMGMLVLGCLGGGVGVMGLGVFVLLN